MTETKKKRMNPDTWKILEYISILTAGIMGVYDKSKFKKDTLFIYNTFLIIFLAFACYCGINNANVISLESKLKQQNDSIDFANNCTKSQFQLESQFDKQREFISGQLTQFGLKIDSVNNKIIKVGDKVVPDSVYKKMNKVLEDSKYNIQIGH